MALYSPRAFIACVKSWIHERNFILPHGEYVLSLSVDIFLIVFISRNLGGVLLVDKNAGKINFISLETTVGHLPHPKLLEMKIKPASS